MNRNTRAALGLAACCLSTLVACSGQHEPGGNTGGNDWTVPGVLRMAGRPKPDNLNPLIGTQVIDTDLSMFWAGYLFNWNNRNEFVPELALRVPTMRNGGISRDGLTFTYHLRHGVRWQDGAPFGAGDVVYTWRQVMNPKNFSGSRQGYDLISGIDTPDRYTLVVHLRHKYAPFVATFFTMSNTTYCVLPKHVLQKYRDLNHVPYNDVPIGTGPFRIASNLKGNLIRMLANPFYWRGPPKLREVDYSVVSDDTALLNDIRAHKIDFYYNASAALSADLHDVRGTALYEFPFTRFADIGFNTSNAALADVRVRRALAYATNRRDILETVTQNVNLLADTDQPPFSWAHEHAVSQYPYDPMRAGALLDEAGWHEGPGGIRGKAGRALHLSLVGFSGSETTIASEKVVADGWRRVGVAVTIKNYPSDRLYAPASEGGIEQSGQFDVAFEEWANGIDPDDSQLFLCDMAPPAGWNIYHFCNKRLDAAEKAALSFYEQDQRKPAYSQIQRILADELPIFTIWFERRQDLVNTDLRNYEPALAVTPFWNTWAWEI